MAHTFTTELKSVAANYVELLKTKVTTSSIQKRIVENPYYPSLLALSDTFDRYNIPNAAYRIDEANFHELASETPFVAFINIPSIGTDFVLVTAIANEKISYWHKNNKAETITKEDFFQRYKGVIWKAEPNEQSGEPDFKQKIKEERQQKHTKIALFAIGTVVGLLTIAANLTATNILPFGTITLLKIIGLTVTTLLLVYEIDKTMLL